jgi:hypothetical protein
MSDAADRLARNRLAILDQIQPRERSRRAGSARARERVADDGPPEYDEPASDGGGLFGRIRYAASTWWRHHPAHMGVELATPVLSAYARRKPMQFLGIAAAVGALLVIVRPWRLISVTGLLVAIAKSSQLSTLVMTALSAADFQRDQEKQE